MGGDAELLRLLKTVALVGMFRERSGLTASEELLRLALPDCSAQEISAALDQLQRWSLVIYRKFDDSFGAFDGSDFDIEDAVGQALESIGEVDFKRVEALAGLQPIVAKRHYHKTGALRWFDVRIVPLAEVEEAADAYAPRNGAIGVFFLTMPTNSESGVEARVRCRDAAKRARDWDVAIGLPQGSWNVTALMQEFLALQRVRDEAPELQGDSVARREIEGWALYLQGSLGGELAKAFDSALWYCRGRRARPLTRRELNGLASALADRRQSVHV